MEIVVKLANTNDAEEIAKCAREAYKDEKARFANEGDSYDGYPSPNWVIHDIKKYTYYKILLDNNIIGGTYIWEKSECVYIIEDFCIHPRYQNKGYGKKALLQLEKINSNIKVWTLTTPIYSIRNQHLYESLGYREIGRGEEAGIQSIKYKKEICDHGDRVTLEFASLKDKKLIYDMLVSPEVIDFMFDEKHPAPTWEEFKEGELDTFFLGAASSEGSYLLIRDSDEVIGSVSYAINDSKIKHAELDIWISNKKYIGLGLGTEAINLVMNYVINNYEIRTFIIRPWSKNINAIKAYKKCGFREIEDFKPEDYYNEHEIEDYGDGDYGKEETINLIKIYDN